MKDEIEKIVSDHDIKHLATLGEAEGVIKPVEREIIHNVFEFLDIFWIQLTS